jgi:hypothetical protein
MACGATTSTPIFGENAALVVDTLTTAIDAAFDQHVQRVEELAGAQEGDPWQTRAALLDYCLSTENRDGPATGCPSPFTVDVARSGLGDSSRAAFLRGTHAVLDELRTVRVSGEKCHRAA